MDENKLKKMDVHRQGVLSLMGQINEEMESFESDYLSIEYYSNLKSDLLKIRYELGLQLKGLRALKKDLMDFKHE